MDTSRALVLAGGGVAGIAWELGVVRGLADAGGGLADAVLAADVVIGTSAGSAVGAQVTSGVDLDTLYAAQLAGAGAELTPRVDFPALLASLQQATVGLESAAQVRRAIGRIALLADTVVEPERLAVVATRLPRPSWPATDLRIVAVDATTGERVVFTAASGVDLGQAVAASCAVPGIWPPVTIGPTRYVDGGVWSVANADLAVGADRVLVLVPAGADAPTVAGRPVADELAELTGRGGRVEVVWADPDSLAAFGADPLAPTTRGPSALAGRAVGRAVADRVAALWG